MPAPVVVAAGVTAFLKGLSALMKHKAAQKRAKEMKRANVAALTTAQKRIEDQRRAKVRTGAALLNSVPATTAGGAVKTNVGIDPSIVADLEKERTYDFESGLPDQSKGATYDFLAGLFGDAEETTTRAFGAPAPGGTTRSNSSTGPSSLLTPPGGITRTPFVPAPIEQPEQLTYEDLMRLLRGDGFPDRNRPRGIALGDDGGLT